MEISFTLISTASMFPCIFFSSSDSLALLVSSVLTCSSATLPDFSSSFVNLRLISSLFWVMVCSKAPRVFSSSYFWAVFIFAISTDTKPSISFLLAAWRFLSSRSFSLRVCYSVVILVSIYWRLDWIFSSVSFFSSLNICKTVFLNYICLSSCYFSFSSCFRPNSLIFSSV